MRLTRIVDKLRDKFVWGKAYAPDEPVLIEPSASRLKERKPGLGDPETIFSFWTDSGRFWYFFHDIKNYGIYDCKLNQDEIANALEQAIMDYNWILVKNSDKHGLSSPLDRPIDLDTIKREGWDWIKGMARRRCHLAKVTKEKNEEAIEKARKSIKDSKAELKESIRHFSERGYMVS